MAPTHPCLHCCVCAAWRACARLDRQQRVANTCSVHARSLHSRRSAHSARLCSLSHAQVLTVEEQQLADTYFNECAKDWDASTHMTKVEWERTCRRVATDRVRFKIQQPHDAKQN